MKTKKLILVASPPACGKTTLARRLARELGNVTYLDKDALNPFGRRICHLAGEDYNPDSPFFISNVRDIEYEVTLGIALDALEYSDAVIVNAPFGRELWDAEYMTRLKETAEELGAELAVVFIAASAELCRRRMIERGSIRDAWKLENWEDYVKNVRFDAPMYLADILRLYVYRNDTPDIDDASFGELLSIL